MLLLGRAVKRCAHNLLAKGQVLFKVSDVVPHGNVVADVALRARAQCLPADVAGGHAGALVQQGGPPQVHDAHQGDFDASAETAKKEP